MTRDMDTTDGSKTDSLRAVTSGTDDAPGVVTVQSAALNDFVAYWQRMRRGLDVPHRSDIDPRGIEPLLANAFIAERIAPGLARMRIAGSHLTDLMGMEVRGMPISAFITPAHRDALSLHLVRLFDQPAMVRLSLMSPDTPGLKGVMMILPLRSDLGDISRALGCLVTVGNVGRGPRRLDITDAKITPLEGAALIGNPAIAAASKIVPAPAKGEAASAKGKAQRSGERSYLRLIKS